MRELFILDLLVCSFDVFGYLNKFKRQKKRERDTLHFALITAPTRYGQTHTHHCLFLPKCLTRSETMKGSVVKLKKSSLGGMGGFLGLCKKDDDETLEEKERKTKQRTSKETCRS